MDRDSDTGAGNEIEQPLASAAPASLWGSDAVAETLRDLGIPWIALNPGASFRGLHDSIVNYLGNRTPQMMLCLHEEHAVALAHGWAKVTGRPMAAAMHSNVGLMHATMAIYNAWCDRMPVLLLGATGPFDAAKRRPWIDWLHTAQDQGALIRNFVKFDDQPFSMAAARESILKAVQIATTPPMGPVYINLDQALQEAALPSALPAIDVTRYRAPPPAAPDAALVAQAAEILAAAQRPVILAGRVGRSDEAWRERIALAERLGARVLTDLKAPAAFPTDHPLHGAPPGLFPHPDALALLKSADAVLSLDWIDPAGILRSAFGGDAIPAKVIHVSVDQHAHHGWSKDHQGLPPADIYLLNGPDGVVSALLRAIERKPPSRRNVQPAAPAEQPEPASRSAHSAVIDVAMVAQKLAAAAGNRPVTILRVPLSWGGQMWHFRSADSYVGFDGGAGIGSGPGMVIGSALAMKGSGRLPVAIIGDGDYLMGVSAFWTAAHYRIPLLVLIVNNRSFFNDELHQERVARQRNRPVENRWIGQRIGEPEIDLAQMARAQGLRGIGPVSESATLQLAIGDAIAAVEAGQPCVVDIRVAPGYDPATIAAMAKKSA
jgi:thiamine pyrophosphate-dependent acetolactate synthase large subunit-like protein